MKKQKVDLPGIYDLFAIRVIIDTPREPSEKMDCWTAYSILADMYTASPSRMKDWISLPKSNGYESLHATVVGPGNKWVEVQFRSRRMDLVAEKGLAAHWRYKESRPTTHRPVDEQYPRHPRKRRQRPDAADEETSTPTRCRKYSPSLPRETFAGSPEEPRCSTSPSTSTPTSARIVPERLSAGRINALTTRFRMGDTVRSSPPPTSSHVRNGSR